MDAGRKIYLYLYLETRPNQKQIDTNGCYHSHMIIVEIYLRSGCLGTFVRFWLGLGFQAHGSPPKLRQLESRQRSHVYIV